MNNALQRPKGGLEKIITFNSFEILKTIFPAFKVRRQSPPRDADDVSRPSFSTPNSDVFYETTISAPSSPSKPVCGTLPNAESVPEFQNHLSATSHTRVTASMPKSTTMTPPAIHLPVSIPSPNLDSLGTSTKRSKAYKSSLASSLSNMMAQLDR